MEGEVVRPTENKAPAYVVGGLALCLVIGGIVYLKVRQMNLESERARISEEEERARLVAVEAAERERKAQNERKAARAVALQREQAETQARKRQEEQERETLRREAEAAQQRAEAKRELAALREKAEAQKFELHFSQALAPLREELTKIEIVLIGGANEIDFLMAQTDLHFALARVFLEWKDRPSAYRVHYAEHEADYTKFLALVGAITQKEIKTDEQAKPLVEAARDESHRLALKHLNEAVEQLKKRD